MISNRAKEIVKIAERILQIVDEISHPSYVFPDFSSWKADVDCFVSFRFAHHSFSTSSHSLLKTFASLLSLYRAVAPVQFLYLIKKEAGKGMQFFNDTEWIQGQISNISIANNLTFSAGDVDRGVKRLGEMARVGKLTLIVRFFLVLDQELI